MTGPAARPASAPSGAPAAPRLRKVPPLLIAASVVAIGWWIALATMAVLTANPVMLNREQVLRAPCVVTAVVDDPNSGRIEIKQEWKGEGPSGVISVANLSAAGAKRGETYLVPLSRTPDGFEVSRTLLPNAAPLIYPATPEAIQQLKTILAARHT